MPEIQSLARGLRILDFMLEAQRAVGVTELAEALALDKSTVSRLVKTLVARNYLAPEVGSRRYVIGRRLYRASYQLADKTPLRERAMPYLVRLMQATSECAHIAVHSKGAALMVEDVPAENSLLRVVGQVGRRIPLHCTAVGKSLLAFADIPFPSELICRTERTITVPDALRVHMEEVRVQGYALDDEEYDQGVRCLAAPIRDSFGHTIAVIGVSGPTVRLTYERIPSLAALVKACAAELSAELGYTE
ncbi:MAG: allantoin degradation transcriptional regulator AllR [Anaerolineae bacterium]